MKCCLPWASSAGPRKNLSAEISDEAQKKREIKKSDLMYLSGGKSSLVVSLLLYLFWKYSLSWRDTACSSSTGGHSGWTCVDWITRPRFWVGTDGPDGLGKATMGYFPKSALCYGTEFAEVRVKQRDGCISKPPEPSAVTAHSAQPAKLTITASPGRANKNTPENLIDHTVSTIKKWLSNP